MGNELMTKVSLFFFNFQQIEWIPYRFNDRYYDFDCVCSQYHLFEVQKQ